MSWKVVGQAALGQGEGTAQSLLLLSQKRSLGEEVMRVEGWKGQQRAAGTALEGLKQGSEEFFLLGLCQLHVCFMGLWLSPSHWDSLRAGCLPSHSRSSLRTGTMVLYLLIPCLRPPGQGPTHSRASLGSASTPEMRSWSWDAISSEIRRRELRICHRWTALLLRTAPHQPPKALQLCTGVACLRGTCPPTGLGYLGSWGEGQVEVPARLVPAPHAEAPSWGMTNTRPYITTINSLSPPQQPLPQGSHSCPYP